MKGRPAAEASAVGFLAIFHSLDSEDIFTLFGESDAEIADPKAFLALLTLQRFH